MPKKGHKQSPEHTAKIAAANRGRKRSREAIEATRAKRIGTRNSPEQIARQAASLKKRYEDSEFRKANRDRQRARWTNHRYTHRGYVRVWIPDDHPMASMRIWKGYIPEHRLVMAEHLGRPLSKSEIVHHINFDRSDNRIENLELMTRSEHMRLHNRHRHREAV